MEYSLPKRKKGYRTYRLKKRNTLGMTTEEIQKDISDDIQSRKKTAAGGVDESSQSIENKNGFTRVDLSKGRKTINDFWIF